MLTKVVPLDRAWRAELRTVLFLIDHVVVAEQSPVLCPRSNEGHTFASERVLRAEERTRNAKSKVTPAKSQKYCEGIFREYCPRGCMCHQ